MTFFFTEGLSFIVSYTDQKPNEIDNSSAYREVINIGSTLLVVSVMMLFLGTEVSCTLG